MKICSLLTQYIHELHMILRTGSNYFP